MRAERALLDAAKCMERRNVPGAQAKVRETLTHLRELVRSLADEEYAAAEIEFKQREFDRKLRGEHVGP